MRHLLALSLIATLTAGCTGSIGSPSSDADGTGNPPQVDDTDAASSSLLLPRLSHRQWARTAQAFLRLSDEPSVSLRIDPVLPDTFVTDDRGRSVDPLLARDYRAAAETLADQVVDDPEAFARFVGDLGDGDVETRLARLVEDALPRAFRRGTDAEEIAHHVGIATGAPSVLAATDDDARLREAVRVFVRVALQSPRFVYRVELGDAAGETTDASGRRVRPLTPAEYAAKVFYTLVDGPPDADTLEHPPATADARAALVTKLLADDRARETILAFHRALYAVDESRAMRKDATLFPGMEGLGADAATEAELFLDDVVAGEGGLRELLLSRTTFVNARLAGIYGLADDLENEGFGNRRELPPERAGILTRVSWTGKEADLVERASILRGVYVTRRVLCTPLGIPPGNAVNDAPDPPQDLVTNRERVAYVTGGDGCKGCHELVINPTGFAFERFDAIGRHVTEERGAPVDASGTTVIDGALATFGNAREFLEKAAEAEQTHACYVKNLGAWMYGHPLSEAETSDLGGVAETSRTNDASVRDIVRDLVLSPSFSSLVVEAP